MTGLALAIRLYELDHGGRPDELTRLVPPHEVEALMHVRRYVGDAPERCRRFVRELGGFLAE